ncbi:cellulose synthase complex periplasmic endoglucanase BcsZ [Ferriphaselus sp. R-1]|uniref:cellulose synthase complex periplasmic endoglucanase BcsZ n=1 Tax=Ferriphaselus sp. R-1 TaxID=1485544 RepID=UPI000554ED26|nr:cellulose synthase complex periplasmic endoglucanase BcsZ [Ferriphaselus sp. R-1]
MWRVLVTVIALMVLSPVASAADACRNPWFLWSEFKRNYIQADGRVIDDFEGKAITTSEGQAYALFFALVANDKEQFDLIYRWTVNNLMRGDVKTFLPAWKWGKDEQSGTWKALDYNSASDADVWIAYSLFQAGDIWKSAPYRKAAFQMLANMEHRELADMPGIGWMLLPAPYGYALSSSNWRLNPSYLPIQVLRYFSKASPAGPWGDVTTNTLQMLQEVARNGVIPDWVSYSVAKGYAPDSEMGRFSSYEAIRVYLWWAMLDQADPAFKQLQPQMGAISQFRPDAGKLPERISTQGGANEGVAPDGFVGALAPYRWVLYKHKDTQVPKIVPTNQYYSSVLKLFGYGWVDGRFQFHRDGSLSTRVSKLCSN